MTTFASGSRKLHVVTKLRQADPLPCVDEGNVVSPVPEQMLVGPFRCIVSSQKGLQRTFGRFRLPAVTVNPFSDSRNLGAYALCACLCARARFLPGLWLVRVQTSFSRLSFPLFFFPPPTEISFPFSTLCISAFCPWCSGRGGGWGVTVFFARTGVIILAHLLNFAWQLTYLYECPCLEVVAVPLTTYFWLQRWRCAPGLSLTLLRNSKYDLHSNLVFKSLVWCIYLLHTNYNESQKALMQ